MAHAPTDAALRACPVVLLTRASPKEACVAALRASARDVMPVFKTASFKTCDTQDKQPLSQTCRPSEHWDDEYHAYSKDYFTVPSKVRALMSRTYTVDDLISKVDAHNRAVATLTRRVDAGHALSKADRAVLDNGPLPPLPDDIIEVLRARVADSAHAARRTLDAFVAKIRELCPRTVQRGVNFRPLAAAIAEQDLCITFARRCGDRGAQDLKVQGAAPIRVPMMRIRSSVSEERVLVYVWDDTMDGLSKAHLWRDEPPKGRSQDDAAVAEARAAAEPAADVVIDVESGAVTSNPAGLAAIPILAHINAGGAVMEDIARLFDQCMVCRRTLTAASSLDAMVGPVCGKKVRGLYDAIRLQMNKMLTGVDRARAASAPAASERMRASLIALDDLAAKQDADAPLAALREMEDGKLMDNAVKIIQLAHPDVNARAALDEVCRLTADGAPPDYPTGRGAPVVKTMAVLGLQDVYPDVYERAERLAKLEADPALDARAMLAELADLERWQHDHHPLAPANVLRAADLIGDANARQQLLSNVQALADVRGLTVVAKRPLGDDDDEAGKAGKKRRQ